MGKIDSFANYIVKHSDAIFTGFAMLGTVGTAVLAVKATPGALDDIDKAYAEKGEALTKKEVIKAAWKRYIPAATSGTLTIGCIFAADRAHIRKETALAATAAFMERRYSAYQDKVVEIAGDEVNKTVEDEIAKDHIMKNPPKVKDRKDGDILCYEPNTEQYFISNAKELLWAELTANKILSMEEKVTLNQVLALFADANHKKSIGNQMGWWLDESYYEFIGYNWGYYGRPWLDIDPRYVDNGSEKIAVLHFSVDPVHEEAYDVDEMMETAKNLHSELYDHMDGIKEEVKTEEKKSQKKQ